MYRPLKVGHRRTLKPDLLTHAQLFALGADALESALLILTFAGCWGQSDRNGVFPWLPLELKRNILPYFNGVDFEHLLDRLVDGGFLARFDAEGQTFGLVPAFHRHQNPPKKEPSRFPAPPLHLVTEDCRDRIRLVDPRQDRRDHTPTPDPAPPEARPRHVIDPQDPQDPQDLVRLRHRDRGRSRARAADDDDDSRNGNGKLTLDEVARLYREVFGRDPPESWLTVFGVWHVLHEHPEDVREAWRRTLERGEPPNSAKYVQTIVLQLQAERERRSSAPPAAAPPPAWSTWPVCEACEGRGCESCEFRGRVPPDAWTECACKGTSIACGKCVAGYLPPAVAGDDTIPRPPAAPATATEIGG